MFHSIRWRLIFSYTLITLLTVAVVGALTYQIVGSYIEQQEYNNLRSNAEAVALQAESWLWSRAGHYELNKLTDTAAFLADVRVRVLDGKGEVLSDSGIPGQSGEVMLVLPFGEIGLFPEIPGEISPDMMFYSIHSEGLEEIPELWLDGFTDEAVVTIVRRGEGPWGGHLTFEEIIKVEGMPISIETKTTTVMKHRSDLAVTVPIGTPNSPDGFVELSAAPNFNAGVLDELRQALFTAGIGAVVVAGVFGLWNSHRLAAPLKKLADTSAQMGSGDLTVRADVKSRDEIGALATQFNQMAAQLETNFQQLAAERDALRRFITDASHELRTPITALKNFNTLLLDQPSDEPRAEFLAESQIQINRLEWITANLLDLSRLDSGLSELDFAKHNFVDIIQTVVASFAPLATDKNISLVAQFPDNEFPIHLNCDRPRLEMALSNLVDNALKFTPKGGAISIGIAHQPGIQVWVQDNGVGISLEDLPHIFDRFYRGRDHAKAGSGLGLAIVKSIMTAHGGAVEVETNVGQGTKFILRWESESVL